MESFILPRKNKIQKCYNELQSHKEYLKLFYVSA